MAYNKFITKNGTVLLDLTEDTIAPENFEKGIVAHDRYGNRIVGTLESEFNIAYGENEPEDPSKLWIKASKPDSINIVPKISVGQEELELGIATLPKATGGIATAKIGTKIYLFGGGQNLVLDSINVFDIETQSITSLNTKLPKAGYDIAAASVGTKIYLFGGASSTTGTGFDTINVFDTETGEISTLSTKLPANIGGMAAEAIGAKIYLFGGAKSQIGDKYDEIYIFNTETNSVIKLDAMLPERLNRLASARVGTKVYLFGGDDNGGNPVDTISVFNTENDTISKLSIKLPAAACGIGAASIGTKIYLFGGETNKATTTINVFDTETQSISTLSTKLPEGANETAAVADGTKVYLFGGILSNDNLDTVHAFNTVMPLAANTMLIETSTDRNIVNLLPNLKLGVNNVYLGDANGCGEKVNAYLSKTVNDYAYDNYYASSASGLGDKTGTTLTATVDCEVNDLIVAAIVTRDTFTVSDDWTLLSQSNINSIDDGTNQTLAWAYKTAKSTTESITVTQASEQRLYINMVALPGATGVIDHGYSYDNSGTTNTITVSKPDGLVLWGMTTPTWNNSAPYDVWTTSYSEMPIVQIGTSSASRLGIGLDQSTEKDITFRCPAEEPKGIIVGCLAIQGIDKFYTATPCTRTEWVEI